MDLSQYLFNQNDDYELFLKSIHPQNDSIFGLFLTENVISRAIQFLLPGFFQNYLPVLIVDSPDKHTIKNKFKLILQKYTDVNFDDLLIISSSSWFQPLIHNSYDGYENKWEKLIEHAKSLNKSGLRVFIDDGFLIEENISHWLLTLKLQLKFNFPLIKMSSFNYDVFVNMRPMMFKKLRNKHRMFYTERKYVEAQKNDDWSLVTNQALYNTILSNLGDIDKEKILESIMTEKKSIFQISLEKNIPRTSCYRKFYELLQDGMVVESGTIFESGVPISIYGSLIKAIKFEISAENNIMYVKWN